MDQMFKNWYYRLKLLVKLTQFDFVAEPNQTVIDVHSTDSMMTE